MNLMKLTRQIYKAGIFLFVMGTFLAFTTPAKAADAAMFSATADKTSYIVGDTIKVSLSVDSGPYAATLNAIDMTIKTSDVTVVAPDGSSPYTAGTIFSQVGLQSVSGDSVNVVTYINPSDKPASRSGYLGSLSFKALKAGSVTISYDKIQAAEEGKDNEFANTSASSLVLTVGEPVAATATPSGGSTVTTLGVSQLTTITKTPSAKTTTQAATTGPSEILLVLIIGAGSAYIIYKLAVKSLGRKII
jgi:hypothetical protein